MLDSLTIKGFKLFSHLEVPRLARLNLFVGGNNTGKSCLLEAIRLFTSNGSFPVIRELVRVRDGDWEANIVKQQEMHEEITANVEAPIRFLFHDFHCQGNPNALIEIGPPDEAERLRLSLGFYRQVESEDGSVRRVRIESNVETTREDADEMLEVMFGRGRRRIVKLNSLWPMRFPRALFGDEPPRQPIISVGTSGMSREEVGFLWDQVSLTPQQGQILDCLRLIDTRLQGLTLVDSSARRGEVERIPVISVKDSSERFPLRTMGDGLTRLFHIALAIVNAQDGVVLIDEFENGLYWEVQEQLWPVLFKLAQQFNVQVFATSHSSDCVRSFANAWAANPTLGSMYRLQRTKSSAELFSLPMTNVSDALASQVEVR